MEPAIVFIGLALAFGLFMAWGIGANDVANAMATSIGAGALTVRQALLVAGVFEFAGAVLAGGEVTKTIRKGMVDTDVFNGQPEILVYGMLASLLAAALWLLIASRKGWPVSTTHSIVGAIIGFIIVGVGFDAVSWGKVSTIMLSWVISPLIAGIIAFGIFTSIKVLILTKRKPFKRAKKYTPYYIFTAVTLIVLVTIFKGLKHVGLELTTLQAYVIAIAFGAIVAGICKIAINRLNIADHARRRQHYDKVESLFAALMVITACSMAFAHGSNDVANAIGPVAAVVSTVQAGEVTPEATLPLWVLMLGGLGIVVGLGTYGVRVIRTVGKQITKLTPSRGFSAELAAAFTIVVASGTGIPISTTHTLIGAVLGVGLTTGVRAVNFGTVGKILISWMITIPAGAILSIIFFLILRAIFS